MRHGREAHRGRVAAALAEVRSGAGAALVIRGDAGIGKSTLLHTALAGVRDLTVIRAAGVESEKDIPFSGLHQLLSPLLGHLDDLPSAQSAALRRALGLDAGETTDLLVRTATLGLVQAAARRRPLVLAVDDAHALDQASWDVLLFAARRVTGPWGALLALRDGVPAGDLPELRLTGLSPDDAGALLAALGHPADRAAVLALTAATGGNPLALTEFARHPDRQERLLELLQTGRVSVQTALFGDRLSSLSPECRAALLLAAVAPELSAPDTLAEAERAGLVEIGPGVRFRHPLVRSAAYDEATTAERRQAHAIAALSDPDGPRGRRHRALSTPGPDDTLADALERDAADASRRGGLAATVATLTQAARLSTSPASGARRVGLAAHNAWKSGHPQLATHLLSTVDSPRLEGLIALHTGDQVSAYDRLTRISTPETLFMAVEAAYQANRIDAAAEAARRAGTLAPEYAQYGEWLAAAVSGRPADVDPWVAAEAAPPSIRESGAHRWLVPMALAWLGTRPRQAREFLLAGLSDLRKHGMLSIYALPLPWLADLEFRLGLWSAAAEHAAEGIDLTESLGQTPRTATLLALQAHLAAVRGTDCRPLAARALELARPTRNHLAAARATWALGLADLANGDYEQAVERLTLLDTPGVLPCHQQIAREAVADLVEAHLGAGNREAAVLATKRFTAGTVQPWASALLDRCRTLLEPADLPLPEDGPPFERARTALVQGERLRRDRRRRDARTPLRQAADLFETLGATAWSARARAELRACGALAPSPATTLTPQETRIAELAARGLSNREIGTRLVLSPRTVGYHLHKIFPKLGISARAQLRGLDLS